MGYASRQNPNSKWNRKRALNVSSQIASPISNNPELSKATTPVKQDEPMVIEITLKSIFLLFKDFLCRTLKLSRQPQSHAPIS